MSRVLLHLGVAGTVIWWADTGVDPLVCLALYALCLMLIDGPGWAS